MRFQFTTILALLIKTNTATAARDISSRDVQLLQETVDNLRKTFPASIEIEWGFQRVENVTDAHNSTIPKRNLQKREVFCDEVPQWFQQYDLSTLNWALQNTNNYGSPYTQNYLGGGTWVSFSQNSVKLCVHNDYHFDNTHFPRWEVGWAGWRIMDECTPAGLPVTRSGQEIGHGDTGLDLRITARNTAHKCT